MASVDAADGEVGSAAEVAVGVAVRLLVFTGLVYLAAQLHQGHNWARVALAVLYGGIGTLSLVIGPVTWLVEGGSLGDAVAAADLESLLFAASRVVHLGAVIAALVLMFHPAANAYIRATTRAPARRGTRQDRLSPGCWSIAAGSVLALRPCWPFARSGGSGIPRGVHNGDVACELPARTDRGSVG